MLYRWNLVRLWEKTNPFDAEDPNWGHSVVVPLIGLYYLASKRQELQAEPIVPETRLAENNTTLAAAACSLVGFVGFLAQTWPILPASAVLPGFYVGMALMLIGAVLGFMQAGKGFRILTTIAIVCGVAGYLMGKEIFGPIIGMRLSDLAERLSGLMAVSGLLAGGLGWGLSLLLAGLFISFYGIWPQQNDYIKDIGIVVAIFGTVLALCGWRIMRIAWFPIILLFAAIPWPRLMYDTIAAPLQHLAAAVSVLLMKIGGMDVGLTGTQIEITKADGTIGNLTVAEACSGLRSLMTFITLGAAVGFLSDRPLWQKLTMTFAAFPIAITCNVLRVTVMGVCYRYVNEDVVSGFAHSFVGLLMLIPAFFMLLGVGWVLDMLVVETDDDDETDTPPASGARTSLTAASSN